MLSTAEVYLWGTRIGILHLDERMPYAAFEYDKGFIGSGIEVSPIQMPLSNHVYTFPDLSNAAFHGVPGMIADSLPDRFGNAVIDRWLAMQGKNLYDFNVIDRLCYTGSRGMGALEYVPALGPGKDIDERIDLMSMVDFVSAVLNERQGIELDADDLTYSQLLQLGTSAGGARAKAIIAWNEKTKEIRSGQIHLDKDFDYWLVKFDGVTGNGDHGMEDSPQYTLIEYAYYEMALAAGIIMNPCRLLAVDGFNHFMTKRFDRQNGQKLHMQTLGAIAHVDYNVPGLFGYEQAAAIMRRMRIPAVDVEQLFRRMVFNVMAVNQDDHVKNLSFLMDRRGAWRLAPAYDITFSYDVNNRWLRAHQMTVNGKTSDISLEDMMRAGRNMDISTQKCTRILGEVRDAVCRWPEIADSIGIRERTVLAISKMLKKAEPYSE